MPCAICRKKADSGMPAGNVSAFFGILPRVEKARTTQWNFPPGQTRIAQL
jgi:hypothetical protein